MCLLMSIKGANAIAKARELFSILEASPVEPPTYWVASGFDHPRWPVILGSKIPRLALARWGLIPPWVKTDADAAALQQHTLNARAETITAKPAFRQAAQDGRCVILLDGFFEYHTAGKVKYPFYIHMKDDSVFLVAGLAADWRNPQTQEPLLTFSLITTEASTMMAKIHNEKKRMPAILTADDARKWLDPERPMGELQALLRPWDTPELVAHPVSRLLSSRTEPRNVSSVQDAFSYPEIAELTKSISTDWTSH